MDFSKIKNLMKHNGGKFIFLEEGEPEFVVMSFDEYERVLGLSVGEERGMSRSKRSSYEEPVGREDTEIMQTSAGAGGMSVRLEDIHLEDLPL